MTIHEKINARSWYGGELLKQLREVKCYGQTCYTNERSHLMTPYKLRYPIKDKPRHSGERLQPAGYFHPIYLYRYIKPEEWRNHIGLSVAA